MRLILVMLMFWSGLLLADDHYFEEIAPGDVQQLKQAILDSNNREIRTVLRLSGTYVFGAEDELPPIHSNIELWGSSKAYFRFEGESEIGPDRLMTIESGGELKIGFGEMKRFDILRLNGGFEDLSPLIMNRGILTLDRSVIRDIDGMFFITRYKFTPPIIRNEGSFRASESSFINSGFNEYYGGLMLNMGFARFERSVFYSTEIRTPLRNEGEMELVNVSYQGNPFDGSGDSSPLIGYEPGIARIGNSIFAGVGDYWCLSVTSLGHNLVDNLACAFSADGDIVGKPAGLLPLSTDPKIRELFLSAASPAIDSGDPALCNTVSVGPRDGNGDGLEICDRGAFEYYSKGLSDGGANGLYYDPDQDGHYVYILDSDYTTVVMWNTFDTEGNQAWVIALGDLANGRAMIADAYINEHGILTATGPANVNLDKYWGSIQVELDSCSEGTFYFNSSLPNFVSGKFTMKRLATVTQVGCAE